MKGPKGVELLPEQLWDPLGLERPEGKWSFAADPFTKTISVPFSIFCSRVFSIEISWDLWMALHSGVQKEGQEGYTSVIGYHSSLDGAV